MVPNSQPELCTRDTIFTTTTRKVCNYSPMNNIILRSQIASRDTAAFRKPVEMKRKVVAPPGSAGLLAQSFLRASRFMDCD